MADIGVVHDSLTAGGGAEAVGVHTLRALLDRGHDVTLYTQRDLDLGAVCRYYGVEPVADLEVRTVTPYARRGVQRLIKAVTGVTHAGDLPLLRRAVLNRAVQRRAADHDALVSTHGEFWDGDRSLQYIHFPYYSRRAMQTETNRFDELLYPTYHRACRAFKRLASDGVADVATVTNSEWTATVVEEVYGVRPTVIYPPVKIDAFDPPGWEEMEAGFVTVGRPHPEKRQTELIEVVDGLRKRGHDVHLHVVGGGGSGDHRDRLRELAASRGHVHREGRLKRAELIDLLERHRFGLHGRTNEPFGIAVAEMVAAGSIPFVPAAGGQTEVVARLDDVIFDSFDEAPAVISSVLSDDVRQRQLHRCLRDGVEEFAADRFQAEMAAAIEALD
jgi:glycosyltransferase involved in cell wall biosynthesis